MKIFDWVHRSFCRGFDSSTIVPYEDGKPRVSIKSKSRYTNDGEKEALLDPNNLVTDMVDNWKLDDILTIGTLAINPLEALEKDELDVPEADDGDEKNAASEKLAFDGECKDIASREDDGALELDSMLEDKSDKLKLFLQDLRNEFDCNDTDLVYDNSDLPAKEEELKKDQLKGKRVTLAELFIAEQDLFNFDVDQDREDVKIIPFKKHAFCSKKSLSKAKKLLLHQVKEDLHPLKKFKKFMKKIIKKKVQPEITGKNDEEANNGTKSPSWSKQPQDAAANIESVPLLHVHG